MKQKTDTNQSSKLEILFIRIGVAVIIIVFFWMLWDGFLKNVVPHTRTYFLSYSSFRREEQAAFFPDQLPASTKNVRYYCYRGNQDSKIGVAFIIEDDDEYNEMKAFYREQYIGSSPEDKEELYQRYLMNQPLTVQFMDENDLVFIEELLLNDVSNYKIVGSKNLKQDIWNRIEGVVCNDVTQEIIVFRYVDAHN